MSKLKHEANDLRNHILARYIGEIGRAQSTHNGEVTELNPSRDMKMGNNF